MHRPPTAFAPVENAAQQFFVGGLIRNPQVADKSKGILIKIRVTKEEAVE